MLKKFYLVIILFAISFKASSQDINHVTHTSGLINIAGTDVTVTQTGCLDVLYSYCPAVTSPYLVGFTLSPSNYCNGAYTFDFDPPLESLTLNFSGVTNVQEHQEVMILEVNDVHYPLATAGSLNSCDDYAVVDADGNIAGCSNCIESGWKGTQIQGPISKLSVIDSVIVGSPGGALFSLFISEAPASIEDNIAEAMQVYPNPFSNEIKVITASSGIISVIDSRGALILTERLNGGTQVVNTDYIASGAYILKFLSDKGDASHSKLMKI